MNQCTLEAFITDEAVRGVRVDWMNPLGLSCLTVAMTPDDARKLGQQFIDAASEAEDLVLPDEGEPVHKPTVKRIRRMQRARKS